MAVEQSRLTQAYIQGGDYQRQLEPYQQSINFNGDFMSTGLNNVSLNNTLIPSYNELQRLVAEQRDKIFELQNKLYKIEQEDMNIKFKFNQLLDKLTQLSEYQSIRFDELKIW